MLVSQNGSLDRKLSGSCVPDRLWGLPLYTVHSFHILNYTLCFVNMNNFNANNLKLTICKTGLNFKQVNHLLGMGQHFF